MFLRITMERKMDVSVITLDIIDIRRPVLYVVDFIARANR